MFVEKISAAVLELHEHAQTQFQCTLSLTMPLTMADYAKPGRLIAAENIFHAAKDERYCVMQILSSFPARQAGKKKTDQTIAFECKATPIGIELLVPTTKTKKKAMEIVTADVFPAFDGAAYVLDDDITMQIIHHLAPGSRGSENGTRIDIGAYSTNPDVHVGADAGTLLRGNIAIVSARPRARTSMTNHLIQSLLSLPQTPMHIVYCDVNYQGTLSLTQQLIENDRAQILCVNDKFVPPSIFSMFKNPADRQLYKRAVYDYLDMMILPSVLESRRRDFLYPIAEVLRANKLAIYRPHEPTVDDFINDIRTDILDGVDQDVEEVLSSLMRGIAENFKGERFTEKNVRDMIEMIDETGQETKIHGARRTLYDLRTEIQTVYESFAKDLPTSARKTLSDVVTQLNDESHASLHVVQGQKSSDILRFISALVTKLVDERLRRLKLRVPVLFIFNNADDLFTRGSVSLREGSSERFTDILQTLLFNGRRHGLGFCVTLENCTSLDKNLARKIQSYFVGPIRFTEDVSLLESLLNVSGSLFQPAVGFEDGRCFFMSADSPYQRRVPLPIMMPTHQESMHAFLDEFHAKIEKQRRESPLAESPREPRPAPPPAKPMRSESPRREPPRHEPPRLEPPPIEPMLEPPFESKEQHPRGDREKFRKHRGRRGKQQFDHDERPPDAADMPFSTSDAHLDVMSEPPVYDPYAQQAPFPPYPDNDQVYSTAHTDADEHASADGHQPQGKRRVWKRGRRGGQRQRPSPPSGDSD